MGLTWLRALSRVLTSPARFPCNECVPGKNEGRHWRTA